MTILLTGLGNARAKLFAALARLGHPAEYLGGNTLLISLEPRKE